VTARYRLQYALEDSRVPPPRQLQFPVRLVLLGLSAAFAAATVDVGVADFQFTPSNVNANVGDTIMWTVNGGTHTVTESSGATCTSLAGGFDSGAGGLSSGQMFMWVVTAAAAGTTVNYHCQFHCASNNMTATITVAAASPPPPSPPPPPPPSSAFMLSASLAVVAAAVMLVCVRVF